MSDNNLPNESNQAGSFESHQTELQTPEVNAGPDTSLKK